MTTCTPLDEVLQQLAKDCEDDPSFAREKLADVKRACDLMGSMMRGGSAANDVIHATLFVIARLLMMATPTENEVNIREQYTRLLFDYMTQAMHTPVCPDCGYPHGDEPEIEEDVAEVEAVCYTPPSTHLH